jgi:hypothetical protein
MKVIAELHLTYSDGSVTITVKLNVTILTLYQTMKYQNPQI